MVGVSVKFSWFALKGGFQRTEFSRPGSHSQEGSRERSFSRPGSHSQEGSRGGVSRTTFFLAIPVIFLPRGLFFWFIGVFLRVLRFLQVPVFKLCGFS